MRARFSLVVLALVSCAHAPPPSLKVAETAPLPNTLRSPSSFDAIADPDARSQALFTEAARVMLHPRCVNCHPAGDSPTQGDDLALHDPPVVRGTNDRGAPALACVSCHQDHNLELARVPGAPNWHLAPRVMTWAGRSVAALCQQIKDPARNGGRGLAQIVDHGAHDPLVAWGWSPGHQRAPAPGDQATFGALLEAWQKSGAACPAAKVAVVEKKP